ncbi:DUF4433 domain-containing protein [Trichocoleus sp. DQ-U1]|uniref:type II toxin-antitoxin system toxin DNA ADP-ribosyl transferase DarT n=1 Tax=Trichocoleus sp. DQ-U1 TaxID=2933926 RepID=UPI003299D567
MPTCIYHITHINNLLSILNSGGLIANSKLRRERINYVDIAHESIQDRRARTLVPCGAGGVLHDYVPFYFARRSPMLFTIHKGNVEGYNQGQESVIYLVSTAEAIEAMALTFAFTDGHGIIGYTQFSDDLEDLDMVDWDIMEAKYWNDTADDNDRKRRRQAEFLVHQFCPWTLITGIGVINTTIQEQVQRLLQKVNYQPPVKVYPNWYY